MSTDRNGPACLSVFIRVIRGSSLCKRPNAIHNTHVVFRHPRDSTVNDVNAPAAPAVAGAALSAPSAPDIEQPACFYLGREFDLAAGKVLDKTLMYDARDLTTHGVVVGMTGSGKTGLCIALLEEAAIDGIPCIIIDPKGDLTNLLLQFPDLEPARFQEWINPGEAEQKKMKPADYAAELAGRWRQGLEESGQLQPLNRIQLLRDSS